MIIEFQCKELQRCAEDERFATRHLGVVCAKKYHQRLAQLEITANFEELRNAIGRFHELTGDRKGQWSFDLEHPYRLIVTPKTQPIPVDKDGKYIWQEISDALIVEIVNYHKEG